jgi:hypothetical protein
MDIFNKWTVWMHTNPQALKALIEVAKRAHQRGYDKWSVKAAFEVLRWESEVKTNDPVYKLNNNLTASAARWLMENGHVPVGFFETRVKQS